jgi:hypothetical protein
MWTAVDGQEVHLSPESIPDHTAKYIARDPLAAVKRFYENPSNRAAFEEWRRKRKKETE